MHGSSRAAAKGSGPNWNWMGADWPTHCSSVFPRLEPGFIKLQFCSSVLVFEICWICSVSRRGHGKPPARASIGSMCYYVRKLFQVASRLCIIPAARDLETITDCPADSTRRCTGAPHGSAEHQSSGKLEWDPLSGIDPLSGPPVTPLLQHYSSIPGRPHVEDQEKPLAQCQPASSRGMMAFSPAAKQISNVIPMRILGKRVFSTTSSLSYHPRYSLQQTLTGPSRPLLLPLRVGRSATTLPLPSARVTGHCFSSASASASAFASASASASASSAASRNPAEMAPPQSALEFLDFVNASPTRMRPRSRSQTRSGNGPIID